MDVPIYILLGSNLGDRQENLNQARQAISRYKSEIITASSIYKTSAWGKQDQPDFYNQVLEIRSSLPPDQLMIEIQAIEKNMGRIRYEKWGARVIDIDILFYGDSVLTTEQLTIPHPGIPHRKFTLLPLSEIAPDFIHPSLRKPIHQLLTECGDDLPVEKL